MVFNIFHTKVMIIYTSFGQAELKRMKLLQKPVINMHNIYVKNLFQAFF